MSISISAIENSAPPHRLAVCLTCDGDHGLLPPLPQSFEGDDYIEVHHRAVSTGWRFKQDGTHRCPECR